MKASCEPLADGAAMVDPDGAAMVDSDGTRLFRLEHNDILSTLDPGNGKTYHVSGIINLPERTDQSSGEMVLTLTTAALQAEREEE